MLKKKLASLFIAFGLVASLATPVFADEIIIDEEPVIEAVTDEEGAEATYTEEPEIEAEQIEEIEEDIPETEAVSQEDISDIDPVTDDVEEGVEIAEEEPEINEEEALVGNANNLDVYDDLYEYYVNPGDTVTLSPHITCDTGYTCSWTDEEGNPLPDATGEVYTFKAEKARQICLNVSAEKDMCTVYYAVHINHNVSFHPEGSDYNWINVYVPYNTTGTLKTTISDPTGITYEWRNESTGDTWTDTTGTAVTTPVTYSGSYSCCATDEYDNKYYAYFFVYVDNGFELTTNYDDEYGEVSAQYNDHISLEVYATATDASDMTYMWYDNAWNDITNPEHPSKIEFDCTNSGIYTCYVRDRFNASKSVTFNVTIDNGLSVSSDLGDDYIANIHVIAGMPYTITPTITAKDMTDMRYEWFSYEDEATVGTDSTYTIASPEEQKLYNFTAYDRFQNSASYRFYIYAEDELAINYQREYSIEGPTAISVSAVAGTANPITYEWSRYDDLTEQYVPIAGATESSYLVTPETAGEYECLVTCGEQQRTAYIVVEADTGFAVDTENFESFYIDQDETLDLVVSARSNLDKITYMWALPGEEEYKEGTNTFTVNNSSAPGAYRCRVSDGVNWKVIYFYIYPISKAVNDGESFTVKDGETVKFTAQKAGKYVFDMEKPQAHEINIFDVNEHLYDSIYDSEYYEGTQKTIFPATASLEKGTYYIQYWYYDESGKEASKATINSDCNHQWDAGIITKKATCVAAGTKTYTCTKCKGTKTEEIPIDANAHAWDDGKVTKEPTALEEGVKTYTCKNNAAHKKTEKIAKLPATATLNVSGTVPLKVKQTSKKVVVNDLAKGDAVASAKADKENIVKATVSGNTIVLKAGKKTGSTTVKVTLKSGKTLSFKVKVQKTKVKTKKIAGITKNYTLKKGSSVTLAPVITPVTTTDKLTFKTSNKKVATVSKSGKIKAKSKGKATITVKSGRKTFKVKVTVK